MRRPWIKDRRTALVLGYGAALFGVFVLRDAYEHRNQHRPWWSTFIPGG